MSRNGNIDLGRCCCCEREGAGVRNILMLGFRSPEPGEGCWGCLQCGLPMEGAVAVVCDDCLAAGLKPELACLGPPAANRRIPVDALTERFEHDVSRHPELVVQKFRRNHAMRS